MIILLALILVLLTVSCSDNEKNSGPEFVIGFSQCYTEDVWRQTMNTEMRREISLYNDLNLKLIIKDAQGSNNKQIEDIRELIDLGINILLISPNESEPLTSIVEEVYEKGIPVVVLDRKIESDKFNAFIGSDNYSIGMEAGNFASNLLKSGGNVLEITGLTGSTPAYERSKGFRKILENRPDIHIIHSLDGRWLHQVSRSISDSLFQYDKNIDLIFAHNDPMAYGAFLSSKKNFITPYILGVDGLSSPGLDLIINRLIDATFHYPTGGDIAIKQAVKILSGEPYERVIDLQTFAIDNSNAYSLKQQNLLLSEQHLKIDQQLERINNYTDLLNQRNLFLILTSSITLLLLISVILIFTLLYKKTQNNKTLIKYNQIINQKSRKIKNQKDNLASLLRASEEAAENRLQHFTNISHEIRNMIALISYPLNELYEQEAHEQKDKYYKEVNRCIERLSKLSSEILIEIKNSNQIKYLNISQGDLRQLLIKITEILKPHSEHKKLHFELAVPDILVAEYDDAIFEKIIYNLITNSINYTNEGGSIYLSADIIHDDVLIQVKDTGKGISSDDLQLIFERFYQVSKNITSNHTTGIGLALTKELVQLHNGEITVSSELEVGTTVIIKIPRFQKINKKISFPKDIQNEPHKQSVDILPDKQIKILVVEDHQELRASICKYITKYYSVLQAENGIEGMDLVLKEKPDLVISDILMPQKDGLEMCREIKNNPITFHIPVILLTALDTNNSAIQGYDTGADAYITKPFNEKLLIIRINNLLKSREYLKKAITNSMLLTESLLNKTSNENKVIQQCINHVHKNISDEKFTLNQLAEYMCMSHSSLYRKIKDITGMKAVDFIKKIKLQYSLKLLMNEELTISEISWQSGFSDAKYFSRIFSSEFGKTPSELRKIQKVEVKEITDWA